MKDSEFIELLNLYLDHEIGQADAARLEQEVHTNPERRRLYRQYCAMQQACTQLAGQYVDVEVPAPRFVHFSPRRQVWYPAALAAAACLTVFLFIRTRESAPATGTKTEIVRQETPKAEEPSFTVVPVHQNTAAPASSYAANDTSFDWLKNTSFSPLDISSKTPSPLKLASPRANGPLLNASQPALPSFQQEKIDWVAFQLQRSN